MLEVLHKERKYKSLIRNGDAGKSKQSVQFKDNRSENTAQLKVQQMANQSIQRKENKTGMPDNLKSGIENLSGIDISDVKVHYNSPQPAQLQAHAFAQGNQIHIASGQERYLPHEAWHVVQQKQGRVSPTKQLKGKVNINDNSGLEKEADVMGAKAISVSKQNNIQKKPIQLLSNSHTYQLNKEKALWALGGAVVTGLGTYLLSKYNERQARLRQEQIITEFDAAIAAAGYTDNAQVRENVFVRTALTQGISAATARELFRASGAAAKDVVTEFNLAGDRKPSVQSAIHYIHDHPEATGFYVEVDIRNLGGLNSVLGHNGADKFFRVMTDISAARANSLKSGKVKVASFRHGGDEFSFLVVAEDGSVNGGHVDAVMDVAAKQIHALMIEEPIGKYNEHPPEHIDPHNPIASIEHPKHKGEKAYYGTGIIYGIGTILGTDEVDAPISIADLQVEAKKK